MNFDEILRKEILDGEMKLIGNLINEKKIYQIDEYSDRDLWDLLSLIVYKKTGDYIDYENEEQALKMIYDYFQEILETIEFTKEEEEYLAYNKYKSYNGLGNTNALLSILIRRELIKIYGDGSIEKTIEGLQNENYNEAVKLIQMQGWQGRKQLEKEVQDNVNSLFNMRINCAGYALKLDTCVFGTSHSQKSNEEVLEQNVTELLETFPFIRLLGDSELKEDEYLVEYRANSKTGHHFVRIEDGIIRDKNESNSPRIIKDPSNEEEIWGRHLKDSPSAIFAVNNNHDIHSKKQSYMLLKGKNFEETALNSIEQGEAGFTYHNHDYTITANEQGDSYIYSDGDVVATILKDEEETVVVIDDEKREYISNTKSTTYERVLEEMKASYRADKEKDEER